MELEQFSFDENRATILSLTAADLKVRACAGAPDSRRAEVAAWSDSDQTGIALNRARLYLAQGQPLPIARSKPPGKSAHRLGG